jgi:hypothetical protein
MKLAEIHKMDMGFNVWQLTAAQRELLIPVTVPEAPSPAEVRKKTIRLLGMEEIQALVDIAEEQGDSDGVTPA